MAAAAISMLLIIPCSRPHFKRIFKIHGSNLHQVSLCLVKTSVLPAGRLFGTSRFRNAVGDATRNSLSISADTLFENRSSKQLLRLIFDAVRVKTGSSHYLKYSTKRTAALRGPDLQWRTTLTMNWPRQMVVEATGRKKIDAERNAATIAWNDLKDSGVIDGNNKPIYAENTVQHAEEDAQVSVHFEGYPKVILQNVYQVVRNTLSTAHVLKYTTKVKGDRKFPLFETTLQLTWPSSLSVSASGRKKIDAESRAALKALQHLKETGVLDENNRPLCHSEQELDAFRSSQTTIPRIDLQEDVLVEMESVIREISSLNLSVDWGKAHQTHNSYELAGLFKDCDEDDFIESKSPLFESSAHTTKERVLDVFNGRPFHSPTEWEVAFRNQELLDRLKNLRGSPQKKDARLQRDKLPIARQRTEILDALRKHPVIVLVGETGCGKTTQVPQFILEEMTGASEGAECNIVVTQPRRIGAVSIARRVAEERCERLGEVVGYRVRLDGCVPQKLGRILYCSTGDLMRRLLANPNLVGVSHVVVDEVHERDVLVDFLLILLRDLIRKGCNPNLRVLIMSATLDHQRIVSYFDDCPTINVQGFIHPVREFYREDLQPEVVRGRDSGTEPFVFDADEVVDVVRHVDATRPQGGAILVFLPGWQEIKIVHERLRKMFSSKTGSYWILPVHSRLSSEEQSLIFERPIRADIRKIVLATNIAETSITVDDVSYVIDCGLHREVRFVAGRGITSLETRPVSLANARQRMGRAGRTRPGECFHLYPRSAVDDMDPFPTPEMQRAPLEAVVLDAKAYMPNCTAADFLAKALDPPSTLAVRRAVRDLQDMDMLDIHEALTPLGKLALHFTAHPRLAKAAILSTMFGCEDDVLTVAAVVSNYRNIFLTSPGQRHGFRSTKTQFKRQFVRPGDHSDHLTAVNAFESWLDVLNERGAECARSFCTDNGLNADALHFAKGIKEQLSRQLPKSLSHYLKRTCRDSDLSRSMTKLVLAASFTPNLLHLRKGSIIKSRIVRDAINFIKMNGGTVVFTGDSVNHMEPPFEIPWLVYFSSMHSVQRRREVIRESSAVPLVVLFLVTGKDLKIVNETNVKDSADVILALDGSQLFKCQCSLRTAKALINIRQATRLMLRWLILNAAEPRTRTTTATQIDTHGRLVAIIARLIGKEN